MALLGAHVSVEGGLWRAFERGMALGCQCIQIFTKSQLQWFASPVSIDQCQRFYRAWRSCGFMPVVAHGSYLINLASSDLSMWERSVEALVMEMQRCDALGIESLVFHPGHHGGAGYEAGMANLERGIEAVLERSPSSVRLLLEPSAGQGTAVGYVLKDCVELCVRVGIKRVGLCLDTCHLFAAGYDIRSPGGYRRTLGALGDMGASIVGCWHLNDSKDPKGSRKDRHERVGNGAIGLSAFAMVLQDQEFSETPAILEISPAFAAEDMAILSKLR